VLVYNDRIYPVISNPPVEVGAVHDTLSCCDIPRTTVGAAGTAGTVAAIKDADRGEYSPVPWTFVAAILNVYAVPLVRLSIVPELSVPENEVLLISVVLVPIYALTI
jgi:hypothetical protein